MASQTFKLYRYQLLPIDRHTPDLFLQRTLPELIEEKNLIFQNALQSLSVYKYRNATLSLRVESDRVDAMIIQLAPPRSLTRETADFRRERVEHWPHVNVVVLNRPDEQYFLIQDRQAAFANTDIVVKIIERATREQLARAGLRLHVEQMFEKSEFWNLVEIYRGKIVWVEFEFITPNMANISRTLSQSLKDLSKETNAFKTEIELEADPQSSLNLQPSNETVNGLVDYTSEGGGGIRMRVKGVRKIIRANNKYREVSIDELTMSGGLPEMIRVVREILK